MTFGEKVPFLDLVTPHLELEEEFISIFKAALRKAEFIGGKTVEDFERDFAQHCDTQFCVGVGSGTDALRLALLAAGIGQDEVVVTVPNTFISTAEAISQVGARLDFVDVDERTYNMSPERLKQYLEECCYFDGKSGRLFNKLLRAPVTAIIPVHLYGQTADMDPLLELGERYNLVVIEDACQAHGAEYFSTKASRWKKAGSMGGAAAFSFYPGKNLGACGEAGAVTTNNQEIARKVRMIRNHGQAQKYHHEMEGYNARLDAIQAAILRIKLRYLADWNKKRRENAYRYNDLLSSAADGITLPFEPSWARAVYHLYAIRAPERDQLRKYLGAANIETGIHYPIPLHLQNAYKALGYKAGDFPVTEKVASEILSLPMYPQLGVDEQMCVVQKVSDFFSLRAASETSAYVLPVGRN